MAMQTNGMCRLCATPGGQNMTNILTDESEYTNMAEIILKYFDISILSEDTFPKEVCECCIVKIKSFDEYVEQCLRAQNFFLKLNNSETETIKDEDLLKDVKCELAIELGAITDEVKHEDDVKVKEELLDDMDEDMSNSLFDDGLDYPISDLLPKKQRKKKLKSSRKKKLKLKHSSVSDSEPRSYKKSDPNLQKYFSFACFVCEKLCINWFRLKAHIVQEHNQQPKVQCKCGCVVRSKTAIYRHVSGHNDPSSFACDKCSRIMKTQDDLDKHKMRHIPKPDRVYSCSGCSKVFNSKENLRSHERVHIPLFQRYIYPCSVCGNKFTTKSAVVGHTRAVHEKIKRYICDVCGYACSTGGELIQHRAIHSEEKLFQCSRCPKKFKTGSNLKAHLDTHDSTSYPCGTCDKVLNSRRTYRKHLLVHDDLCRHICPFCNKAFKRRQTLKVHLTCHTGDTPIQCPWCPQRFAYSSACRSHKQRCHPEELAMMAPHHSGGYASNSQDIELEHRSGVNNIDSIKHEHNNHMQNTITNHISMPISMTQYDQHLTEGSESKDSLKNNNDNNQQIRHTDDAPIQCPWCPQSFTYSSACIAHKQRCHPEELAIMAPNTSGRYAANPQDIQLEQHNNIDNIKHKHNHIQNSVINHIQTMPPNMTQYDANIAEGSESKDSLKMNMDQNSL